VSIRFFVRLSLALNLLIACALGPESRAIISGTVADPQGAVVPLATVEVINLETNVVSKTVSNDAFNSPRFGNPTNSATSSQFGIVTLAQADTLRSIQLSLRLSF
jgi:uncharacterized membrane protein